MSKNRAPKGNAAFNTSVANAMYAAEKKELAVSALISGLFIVAGGATAGFGFYKFTSSVDSSIDITENIDAYAWLIVVLIGAVCGIIGIISVLKNVINLGQLTARMKKTESHASPFQSQKLNRKVAEMNQAQARKKASDDLPPAQMTNGRIKRGLGWGKKKKMSNSDLYDMYNATPQDTHIEKGEKPVKKGPQKSAPMMEQKFDYGLDEGKDKKLTFADEFMQKNKRDPFAQYRKDLGIQDEPEQKIEHKQKPKFIPSASAQAPKPIGVPSQPVSGDKTGTFEIDLTAPAPETTTAKAAAPVLTKPASEPAVPAVPAAPAAPQKAEKTASEKLDSSSITIDSSLMKQMKENSAPENTVKEKAASPSKSVAQTAKALHNTSKTALDLSFGADDLFGDNKAKETTAQKAEEKPVDTKPELTEEPPKAEPLKKTDFVIETASKELPKDNAVSERAKSLHDTSKTALNLSFGADEFFSSDEPAEEDAANEYAEYEEYEEEQTEKASPYGYHHDDDDGMFMGARRDRNIVTQDRAQQTNSQKLTGRTSSYIDHSTSSAFVTDTTYTKKSQKAAAQQNASVQKAPAAELKKPILQKPQSSEKINKDKALQNLKQKVSRSTSYDFSLFESNTQSTQANAKPIEQKAAAPEATSAPTAPKKNEKQNRKKQEVSSDICKNGTPAQRKYVEASEFDEWTCPQCGNVNQEYVGVCACGRRKPRPRKK
ncbi:MAG: hypothetical protein IIZ46_03015 [Clostridia bacterium]|nr:hypothetical protein [Clostridia bacterium]